jgi:serine/threonine-protein phosphatase 4 regulatory subunit 1
MDAEEVVVVADATISVQAFTPILGTLLLSPNPQVGGVARYAVVDLLERIRKADDAKGEDLTLTHPNGDVDFSLVTGLFGPQERAMFQDEMLQQVVIGMGHLDIDAEYPISPGFASSDLPITRGDIVAGRPGQSESFEYQPTKGTVNPYFPTTFSDHSFGPNNSHTSTPLDLSLPNNRLIDSLSDKQTSPPTPTTHLTRTRFINDVPSSNSHSVIPADQLNPPQSGRLSPELVDSVPPGKNEIGFDSAHDRVGFSWKCTCDDTNEHDDYDDQKAAVGRLSSMSLMAAVTASGK